MTTKATQVIFSWFNVHTYLHEEKREEEREITESKRKEKEGHTTAGRKAIGDRGGEDHMSRAEKKKS